MLRAVASCLLTVLIGGPVTAVACEVSCLDHAHGVAIAAGQEEPPTTGSEHAHHGGAADAPTFDDSSRSSAAPTDEASMAPASDCCLDWALTEPRDVSPSKLDASTTTPVAVVSRVASPPSDRSTFSASHALEPPLDAGARPLSTILRI